MKITPLLFLDAFGIIAGIIIFLIVKDNMTTSLFINLISIAAIFIVVRFVIVGLVRVENSALSDSLKFCWAVLILLLPILGSLGALIIVNEKRY